MSVYDEARRKCPKCGKRINHWEENACDNGTCVKPQPVIGPESDCPSCKRPKWICVCKLTKK